MPQLYLELPIPYWEKPDDVELDETKEEERVIIIFMANPETLPDD